MLKLVYRRKIKWPIYKFQENRPDDIRGDRLIRADNHYFTSGKYAGVA